MIEVIHFRISILTRSKDLFTPTNMDKTHTIRLKIVPGGLKMVDYMCVKEGQ